MQGWAGSGLCPQWVQPRISPRRQHQGAELQVLGWVSWLWVLQGFQARARLLTGESRGSRDRGNGLFMNLLEVLEKGQSQPGLPPCSCYSHHSPVLLPAAPPGSKPASAFSICPSISRAPRPGGFPSPQMLSAASQKKCNKAGPGEPSESKSLGTPHRVSQKEHGDKTQRGRAVTRVGCAIPLPVHRAATGGFFFFFFPIFLQLSPPQQAARGL